MQWRLEGKLVLLEWNRHPGEGRGPDQPSFWIPAFAGMTEVM
jgi:hypothetical protein